MKTKILKLTVKIENGNFTFYDKNDEYGFGLNESDFALADHYYGFIDEIAKCSLMLNELLEVEIIEPKKWILSNDGVHLIFPSVFGSYKLKVPEGVATFVQVL